MNWLLTTKDVYEWLDERLDVEDFTYLETLSTSQLSTFLERYFVVDTPAETWMIFIGVCAWMDDHRGEE